MQRVLLLVIMSIALSLVATLLASWATTRVRSRQTAD